MTSTLRPFDHVARLLATARADDSGAPIAIAEGEGSEVVAILILFLNNVNPQAVSTSADGATAVAKVPRVSSHAHPPALAKPAQAVRKATLDCEAVASESEPSENT